MMHNSEPLTPTALLTRSAAVYPERTAIVDDDRQFSYAELLDRTQRLAGALQALGLGPGDRVAVLAPNRHQMLEAHYGVPFASGVLVTLNVRLSAAEIAYILDHSGARFLIFSPDLKTLAEAALSQASVKPVTLMCGPEYEEALRSAKPYQANVADEHAALAINYTSGTTGRPKGVVYTHRGAYLQSLAMAYHSRMTGQSVYLWTLPMFHCNGWCFTWAVTGAGARHVCLPRAEESAIWAAIEQQGVTHLCAAPTVLSSIVFSERAQAVPVWVATGGAPPSPSLLGRARELRFDVTHLYGMTETYGPIVINDWHPEWDSLPEQVRNKLNARQGVGNIVAQQVRVVDQDGTEITPDGTTLGEIAVRGNNVMAGYFRDEVATAAAIPDGWLRTGDLAVRYPDGYIEIRDRAKDLIISGGENISSVEVEQALAEHPAVLEAAVVPMPHPRWGERPAAVVTLRPGMRAAEDELRAHLAARLAGFKIPDLFRFADLPKTATGKIKKFLLKEQFARFPNDLPDGNA